MPADVRDREQSAIRAAFLVALLEDRERGREQPLAHYQQRFPGFEAVIAAEYEAFSAEPDDDASAPAGHRLRYRFDGELGRGGMGVVQRVFDPSLHRYLALKQARAGAGEAEIARFLEEARVTAQLDHPGVVAVHEVGRDDSGAPYFTMPMVRGRTFAAEIDDLHAEQPADPGNRDLSRARVVDVLARVCDTVAFAHSRGVVHRDLKPQNVMVGRFGEVFVVDWGLARALGRPVAASPDDAADRIDVAEVPARDDATATPLWTMAGDVLGTPAYMAPEQLLGSGEVSCKLDVYALGAILYHALAGHAPYHESNARPDAGSVVERAAAGPPPPLVDRAPDAPPELVAICEHAMARDPERRYADAEALRADLRAFADGRVVAAYERGKWAELRKWVRRNRAITSAAMVAVLALVVGLIASLVHADRADRSFRDSVDAVDRMLTRVADAKLRNVPETTAIRRDLLADATGFFERFVAQRPDDLSLRKQAAISYYRVASLHQLLGDGDQAIAANARSLDLLAASRRASPGEPDLLFHTAKAYLQRGSNLAVEEDPDPLATALSFAERRLDAGRDGDPLVLAGLAHDALALRAYRARHLDVAERHARASIALGQELHQRFPDRPSAQSANPHSLLAGILAERGDTAGSSQQLQRAITVRRAYLARFPDAELPRSKLAEALRNHAILCHQLRDEPTAEASITEAVTLRAGIAAQSPEVPRNHVKHANALVHQARIRYENGGTDDALAQTAAAQAALARALALAPDDRSAAAVGFDALRVRHRAWMRLERPDEVAQTARAIAALARPPAPASWRFEAACQLGDAVRLCDRRADADAAQAQLRGELAEQAVTWLRALVADQALDPARLGDPRLDPLRFHAEFPSPR